MNIKTPRQIKYPINLLLFSVLFFSCSGSTNSTLNNLTLKFPINKKAVHAIASYHENADSTWLSALNIQSIEYVNSYVSNDTTYYEGHTEFYGKNDLFTTSHQGSFLVAATDKWVMLENMSNFSDYQIFFKTSVSDTTTLPTEYFSHVPLFPRSMSPNNSYSIYRPGNESQDESWAYIGLFREFKTENYQTWEDGFGKEEGIYLKVDHTLDEFENTFEFRSLIDKNGIITSVNSSELLITTIENPLGNGDSILVHTVNRRISDFKDPAQILDLPSYYDQVKETGLNILE